jgi:cbb3-type cytochrome oxidase maturation protein
MSVLLVLIAVSMLVAAAFLAAFLWAVRSGQFDDRHTPSIRMLFDDRQPPKQSETDRPTVDHHHV